MNMPKEKFMYQGNETGRQKPWKVETETSKTVSLGIHAPLRHQKAPEGSLWNWVARASSQCSPSPWPSHAPFSDFFWNLVKGLPPSLPPSGFADIMVVNVDCPPVSKGLAAVQIPCVLMRRLSASWSPEAAPNYLNQLRQFCIPCQWVA